jgi:serine protease
MMPTQYPQFPADYPNVIKVSAVGPDRRLASYSSFGGPVAIAAPGGDAADGPPQQALILSTYGRNLNPTGYEYLQGTSMAAPHVTGVVALLLAVGTRPQDVRGIIQETAQRLDEAPNPGGGNQYGAGLIDAYAALLRASAPIVRIVFPADNTQTYLRTLAVQIQIFNVGRLAAAVM